MEGFSLHAFFRVLFVIWICGSYFLIESASIQKDSTRVTFQQKDALTYSSTNPANSSVSLYGTRAPAGNWQTVAVGGKGKYIYGIVQDSAYPSGTSNPSEATFSVCMSSDYGASWRSTPIANVPAAYFSYSEIMTDSSRYYLFVDQDTGCIVVGGGYGYTIFVSTDCGATWSINSAAFVSIAGSSSGKDLIGVGALLSDIYYPIYVGISKTYGYNWDMMDMILMSDYEFAAVASDADFVHVMIVTCCSEVYCPFQSYTNFNNTQNSSAWTGMQQSYSCSALSLATDSTGSYWIASLGWGLIASSNFGASWIQLQTTPEVLHWNSIDCDSTCQIIIATGVTIDTGVVFRSSDFGLRWSRVESVNGSAHFFNSSVAMTPGGDYFVVASSESNVGSLGYIYVSSNPYLRIVGEVASGHNEYSVSFSVQKLGTVVSPLYLSVALTVSYYGEGYLNISLLTNESGIIPLGGGLCRPVYPCNSTMENVTEDSYCLFNIPVNSTYVENVDGGSIAFMASISSTTYHSAGQPLCLSNATYFQLLYTLSTIPIDFATTTATNSPLLLFGPRFLAVLIFLGLLFSLFGGSLAHLYSSSSTTRKLDRNPSAE